MATTSKHFAIWGALFSTIAGTTLCLAAWQVSAALGWLAIAYCASMLAKGAYTAETVWKTAEEKGANR